MTVKEFMKVCCVPTILLYDLDDLKKSKLLDLSQRDREILGSAIVLRDLGRTYCFSYDKFSCAEIKKISFCEYLEIYIKA